MKNNPKLISIQFYEIDKNSLILHKTKNYKNLQKKCPEPILLEDGLHIDDIKDEVKNKAMKQMNDNILIRDPHLLEKPEEMNKISQLIERKTEKDTKSKILIEEISEKKIEESNKPSFEFLEK